MEFRFQPNEDKASSTYFSPSTSSSNYFTEQALRAGYFSNGIRRTDFVSNSDPVREAIQREIEKERIREEILAAEIIRKRVLEAEVRREMALERELGFPLVPTSLHYQHNPVDNSRLQERFSLSSRSEVGNFNSLPFQRHPEAAKIFEAKPMNHNIAGVKRKLTAIGGANEQAVGGSKKKPQKEWSCALCKVSATSEQGLNAHLQGKKHKAKEVELMRANGAASRDIDSSITLKKSDNSELSKISSSSKPNHGKKTVQVKKNGEAAVQKKEATSEQGLSDHLQGKKHKAKEVEPRANGTTSKDIDSSITLPGKSDKPEVSKISSSSKPNHGKKPVKAMKKKNNVEAAVQKKQNTEDFKKRFKFWCEDCQVGCQSATVMTDHENGKKHKAQLLAPKQDGGDVKQLVSKNEEAAVQKMPKTEDFKKKFKFWCEQCQVGCHSATTMANHERGKKHMAQLPAPMEDGGDVLATTTTTPTTTTNTTTTNTTTEATVGKAETLEEPSEEIMENVDGEVDGGEEPHESGKKQMSQLAAPEEDSGDIPATTTAITITNFTEATVGKAEAVEEASEEIMETVDGEVDGGEESHQEALEMKATADEVAESEEKRI